jgi:hypothetical protein
MDCRYSFKALRVILLHFKVDKMNRGSFLKKKKKHWKTPEIAGKTRISRDNRKIIIPDI